MVGQLRSSQPARPIVSIGLQERLGALFMDNKGRPGRLMLLGLAKIGLLTARGILLGLFACECSHCPVCRLSRWLASQLPSC